jgi:hypothetical protein
MEGLLVGDHYSRPECASAVVFPFYVQIYTSISFYADTNDLFHPSPKSITKEVGHCIQRASNPMDHPYHEW